MRNPDLGFETWKGARFLLRRFRPRFPERDTILAGGCQFATTIGTLGNTRLLSAEIRGDTHRLPVIRISSYLCIAARSFVRGFINTSRGVQGAVLSEESLSYPYVGIGRHGMRVSRRLTSVTDERQRGSRSDTPFKDDESARLGSARGSARRAPLRDATRRARARTNFLSGVRGGFPSRRFA